jgi:ribosomal protein S27E
MKKILGEPVMSPEKQGDYTHVSQKVDTLLTTNHIDKTTSIEKTIECNHCHTILTLHDYQHHKIKIKCPCCGKTITPKKTTLTLQKTPPHPKKNLKHTIQSNIFELIIILLGLTYLINPTLYNIKIAFTLILIGSIMIFFISYQHHKKHKQTRKIVQTTHVIRYMFHSISDRIALILIIWILLLFIITTASQLEIFFILIFIGFLITRELTDNLTTTPIKKYLDGYIIIFLLAYIFIISEKIINILNM